MKRFYASHTCVMGGDSCNVVQVNDITSRFYRGHLPMKTKFSSNIDYVVSLKWSRVRYNVAKLVFIIECPQYKLIGHFITTWRLLVCPSCRLLICPTHLQIKNQASQGSIGSTPNYGRDGGCSLIIAKATNPNNIKVVDKLAWKIHPPNLGDCIVD